MNFCFKDSAHKIQQQQNQERLEKENPNYLSPESSLNYTNFNSSSVSTSNFNSNIQSLSSSSQQNKKDEFLGRKKTRRRVADLPPEIERAEPVGVKLICDDPHDELKKYFNKTVKS